jgi:hypothetical protein
LRDIVSECLSDPGQTDVQLAAVRCLSLLLSPSLCEPDAQDVLNKLMSLIDNANVQDRADFLLAASMLPRLSQMQARSLFDRGVECLTEKKGTAAYVFQALSPLISFEEAYRWAEEAMLNANGDDATERFCFLAPYVSENRMTSGVLVALDSVIEGNRLELLTLLSMMEGDWLALLGIHPALGGKTGPKSCLETVGGSQAVLETYQAINDAMRWWP